MSRLLHLRRVAPTTIRSFQSSAPAQGIVSTIGFAGLVGVMASPAIPGGEAFINKNLAKDEHKVLAWLGGMSLFGFMASRTGGGGDATAAPTGDGDMDIDKLLAELENPAPKPKVFFVLGPPGAGKGTNCARLVEEFGFFHISAGDCLREERNNPESKDGELINQYIKDGKIVPVEITIKLMLAKMEAQQGLGKDKFLVDGFPRNLNNKDGWNQVVGDKAELCGVLFYKTTEEEVKKRCLARGAGGSGRVDDNLESILKRLNTYDNETFPIIESFRKNKECPVFEIDATPSMAEVWNATKAIVTKAEGN